MGSLKADGEDNKELDDSGYVQDEGNKSSAENCKTVHFLDFSDDVLLCILSHCGPSDLKALGFTCTRLGALIRDRTLWQRVDLRDAPCGRQRLRWLLEHALHAGTTSLMIKGFAGESAGCKGYVNKLRKDEEVAKPTPPPPQNPQNEIRVDITPRGRDGGAAHTHSFTRQCFPLSRPSIMPSWPEDSPPPAAKTPSPPTPCPGPTFTLTPCLLRRLAVQCNLTELALECCNINCGNISLSQFPPGLKYLSLRGAECFNMAVDKSFLFKIQDHFPVLEHLDLSECTWLEPSGMMCLSKLKCLKKLVMTNCPRMTEFVAYASLACRYGFKKLEVFDLRGSPVGDSEASALGWLPELREVYLSAFPAPGLTPKGDLGGHHHYADDVLPKAQELSHWELQEPEYFKDLARLKRKRGKGKATETCLHDVPFSHCTDGFEVQNTKRRKQDKKRKATEGDGPGSSKRKKSSPNSHLDESSDDNNDDDDDSDEEINGKGETEDVNPKESEQIPMNEGNVSINLDERNEGDETRRVSNGDDKPIEERNTQNEGRNAENRSIEERNTQNLGRNGENNGEANANPQLNLANMPGVQMVEEEEEDENGDRIVNIRVNIENMDVLRRGQNIVNFGYVYDEQENVLNIHHEQLNVDDEAHNEDVVQNDVNEQPVRNNDRPVGDEQVDRQIEQNVENRDRFEVNVQNIEVRPQAHVVFVNIGHQLPPFYRVDNPANHDFRWNLALEERRQAAHNPSNLITDTGVRSFGRSDDVNSVQIGGPPNGQNSRPDKSNLRILSIQGYKKITDMALRHLVTAAPKLELIDFSQTSVTEAGVERFRAMRPDVEVVYTQFEDVDSVRDNE